MRRRGAAGDAERAARQPAARAAQALAAFAAPAYGPHGALRLVDADPPVLVAGGAAALLDLPVAPHLRPYRALVEGVRAAVGDQATAALLLAARLVARAADADAPVAAFLDGYALARRQALAVLAAERHGAAPEEALAAVGRFVPAPVVVAGLAALAQDGRLDLDTVEVRAEPREEAAWLDGLALAQREEDPAPTWRERRGRVLVVREALRLRPRAEGVHLTRGAALAGLLDEEEARRSDVLRRLREQDVALLVTPGPLDASLREQAAAAGVLAVGDAPAGLLRRLAHATGAREVPASGDAAPADLGTATVARRRQGTRWEGWLVRGAGPAATLVVPARTPAWSQAARDDAERLLRAAGRVLAEPGALPGGGRWQRTVADALRRAADAAPGKAPLGVQAASRAFAALADDLVRNAGGDPLARRLPPGAEGVLDPAACVRHAVDAAFACAIQVLRVDGRFQKAASTPEALRGTGRPKTPRELQGDVPPLM